MSRILIVDQVCPNPYEYKDLETKGMGGTEASCLRIAHGLVQRGHLVTILQRGRDALLKGDDGIVYDALKPETSYDPNVVISLRDAGIYLANTKAYPNAKHYLWMHDVVSADYAMHMHQHLHDRESDLICVSEWHRNQILTALPGIRLNIKTIYGPMAEYCVKTPTVVDPNKLMFISSPHKGLEETLQIFKALRARDSSFKLYVSNPGYFKDRSELPDGVVGLGTLSHKEVVDHLRSALCLFYPNSSFAETFGLVMAESDSVGTPVIAHNIGAASEVVFHPKEILNCLDVNSVVDRVISYKAGERLIVMGKKEFTLNSVLNKWERVLND